MSRYFVRRETFHKAAEEIVKVLPEFRVPLACVKKMTGMTELDMLRTLAQSLAKRAMRPKSKSSLTANRTGLRYDCRDSSFAIRRMKKRSNRFVIAIIINEKMPITRQALLLETLNKKGSGWR